MKKNIIIVSLLVWNLAATSALVGVWLKSHSTPTTSAVVTSSATTSKQQSAALSEQEIADAQEFTLHANDRLTGARVPRLAGHGFSITATVDAEQQDGVIIAQGGPKNGYSLYVQSGELCFSVRNERVLTTISCGKFPTGEHTITASWGKEGDLALALDGGQVATGKVEGPIPTTPNDGLDVGADLNDLVGPYTTSNAFSGRIGMIRLKILP